MFAAKKGAGDAVDTSAKYFCPQEWRGKGQITMMGCGNRN